MRIKMFTIECGPDGNFHPDEEREVSIERGQQLIDGRHAKAITPRRTIEVTRIGSPEREVMEVPEVGVIQPGETRGRGRRSK